MEVISKKETRNWVVLENEGQKIFGVLHSPPIESPPVVLVFHGFASHKIGTGRSWVLLAEALAQSGIACLRFDLRGCGDSEGQLADLTLESLVSDAIMATKYLEENAFSSIGYFGSSLGGALAILAAARLQSIASLVLWAPVASGELWYKDYLAQQGAAALQNPESFATFRGNKLHPLFREQFGKMFAYKTLEELSDVPLLHFQGDKDETLSLQHQKAFQKYRATSSALTRFVTYPDIGHWLGREKVLPEVIQETVNWFKSTL